MMSAAGRRTAKYCAILASQYVGTHVNRISAPLAQVLCLCGLLLFWSCEAPREAPREAPEEAQTPQTAPQSEENVVMTDPGQAFLERNGAREEVITTDSGLQYEVLVSGDGASPAPADLVTVHYTGTLIDGTVFDSSVQRGQPAEFPANRLIPGWVEALQLMQVGDKWMLYIPSDLAYGERGAGGAIGPNQTLIFEIELLGVRSG